MSTLMLQFIGNSVMGDSVSSGSGVDDYGIDVLNNGHDSVNMPTISFSESYFDYNLTESSLLALSTPQDHNYSSTHDIQYSHILSTAERIGDYLSFYYTPILVFTGSIGNILSVFVFFKTKLKKLSSSYYLAALAVSDTCFLFGLFVQWLNFVDVNLYNRDVFCQFFTFFSNLCSFLSVWFVVAFTVERFIAVMYPLKRQSMCTVKRAKIVLFGLTIIGSIHCMPFIFFSSPRFDSTLNTTLCDIRPQYKEHMTILNYVDTVVVFVVPFTTIVILNVCTGWTVWKFATVRRTMTMQKKKTHRTNFTTTTNRISRRSSSSTLQCTHPNGQNSINKNCSKPSRQRITNASQIKVTKMLLIVSTVFVILNLPSYAMRVRTFLEVEASKTTIVFQYICWFLFLTNFGINFVLYCVSGQNFRRAVISMFRKASSTNNRDGATQVTGVSEFFRTNASNTSRRRALPNQGESWNDMHEMRQIVSIK